MHLLLLYPRIIHPTPVRRSRFRVRSPDPREHSWQVAARLWHWFLRTVDTSLLLTGEPPSHPVNVLGRHRRTRVSADDVGDLVSVTCVKSLRTPPGALIPRAWTRVILQLPLAWHPQSQIWCRRVTRPACTTSPFQAYEQGPPGEADGSGLTRLPAVPLRRHLAADQRLCQTGR